MKAVFRRNFLQDLKKIRESNLRSHIQAADEMRPEYDFSNAIQGKHFREYRQGYTVTINKQDGSTEVRTYTSNPAKLDTDLRPEYDLQSLRVRKVGPGRQKQEHMVRLAPDVAEIFPTSEAVNEALRFLMRITRENMEQEQQQPAITEPSS